jgi:hypothetical protein
LEQQDHLSTESSPTTEPPTTTFAPANLAAADLRLVTDLRDALFELTQAIAQLSTQGFQAQGLPAQMTPATDSIPAPLELQTIPQPSPISVPAKREPPFVHVKPPQVANSGLGKRDQAHWDGIDRRGPERPWNSAPVVASTNPIVQETSLQDSAQIVAHRLHTGAFPSTSYDPVLSSENSDALALNRELRNRSLIGSFLDGALHRNQRFDRDAAKRELSQSAVERQIDASLSDEVDNVVAFKRAAS